MSSSSKAGKASGRKRARQAKSRRLSVLSAFSRLKPTYQMQPYSDEALDALEEELHNDRTRVSRRDDEAGDDEGVVVWSRSVRSESDLDRPPPPIRRVPPEMQDKLESLLNECIVGLMEETDRRSRTNRILKREKPSRDTLVKDLKALGIRSKRRAKRSG